MTRLWSYSFVLGMLLVGLGILLPTSWFQPLPAEDLPTPGRAGAYLFQGVLVFDGLLLLALWWLGWRYVRQSREERLLGELAVEPAAKPRLAAAAVLGVTALAAALRLWKLGSDLWLDEIAVIQTYGPASFLQVFTSYVGSNNHLLNTVLVKLALEAVGTSEQAVRMPATLFGIATVPLLYVFCRRFLSWSSALGVALLLATSYHHVFFSQNARGYSAFVFFALASSLLFERALRSDRWLTWSAYVLVSVAGLASLLIAGFVVAAHAAIGLVLLLVQRMRGRPIGPPLRRLACVFVVIGLLGLHLYAPIVPQVLVYVQHEYTKPSVGDAPLSTGFVATMLEGLRKGLGPRLLLLAACGAPIVLAGFVHLFRRNATLLGAVLLPSVLQFGFMVVRGLSVSPRMFLLLLPCGLLAAIAGTRAMATWIEQRTGRSGWLIVPGVAVIIASFFLSTLRYYYRYPKQDYSGAISYVEPLRAPDGLVVVLHVAEAGFRFYGERLGTDQEHGYAYVRTLEDFDRVLAGHAGGDVFLATTLWGILDIDQPDITARIESEWAVERVFPGTLGDGDVILWRRSR